MNKIIITGNLTKQPELRFTTNEKAVCTFDIANNEGYGDKKQTNYFKVVVWGKIGENCANYLDKGSKVLITGRLGNRSYDDKEGNKKHITEITASEVEFLSSKGTGQAQDNNSTLNETFGDDLIIDDSDSSMPF